MSDRQLSKRSKRRLRSRVALLVAEQAAQVQAPSVDTGYHGDRSTSEQSSAGSMSNQSPSESDDASQMESAEMNSEVRDSSPEDLGSEERFDAEGREVRDSSPEKMETFDVSDAEERCGLVSSDISESSSVLGIESDNEVERPQSQQHVTPLFPQADINTEGFEVAFMSLVQRHNLTYACQSDLLKLFSIALPSPSAVPSSSYMLLTKFIDYGKDTVSRHYCGSCMSALLPGLPCGSSHCSNEVGTNRGVFVQVSLALQLKERFEGKYVTYSITIMHNIKYHTVAYR